MVGGVLPRKSTGVDGGLSSRAEARFNSGTGRNEKWAQREGTGHPLHGCAGGRATLWVHHDFGLVAQRESGRFASGVFAEVRILSGPPLRMR